MTLYLGFLSSGVVLHRRVRHALGPLAKKDMRTWIHRHDALGIKTPITWEREGDVLTRSERREVARLALRATKTLFVIVGIVVFTSMATGVLGPVNWLSWWWPTLLAVNISQQLTNYAQWLGSPDRLRTTSLADVDRLRSGLGKLGWSTPPLVWLCYIIADLGGNLDVLAVLLGVMVGLGYGYAVANAVHNRLLQPRTTSS